MSFKYDVDEEIEVITKENGETETKHPSFGLIAIGQRTCSTRLFGSDAMHSNCISLRITEGRETFRHAERTHFPEDRVIEILLSNVQFTKMLTSINSYTGVPCTIVRRHNTDTPGSIKTPDVAPFNISSMTKKEIRAIHNKVKDHLSNTISHYRELIKNKKTFSKKDMNTLLGVLSDFHRSITNNEWLIEDRYKEEMERITSEAVTEAEAAAAFRLDEMAKDALADLMKRTSKDIAVTQLRATALLEEMEDERD